MLGVLSCTNNALLLRQPAEAGAEPIFDHGSFVAHDARFAEPAPVLRHLLLSQRVRRAPGNKLPEL